MMSKRILGLDIGTSSVKCVCIDRMGDQASFSAPYPGDSVNAFYEGVALLLREIGRQIDFTEIQAIGLAGQSTSYILFDGSDDAHVYNWSDPSGAEYVKSAKALFSRKEFIEHISMPCPDMSAYPIPRVLYFQNEKREEWKRLRKLLQPKDYLFYRLTGTFFSDKFYWRGLANIEDGLFHRELLDRIGLDLEKLPALRSSFSAPVTITSLAAEQLGLPTDMPVYLGCNDYYASLLGMGVTQMGWNFDITGTSEHVGTILPKLPDADNALIDSAFLEGYVHYGVTNGSGKSIQWAFDNFGGPIEPEPERFLQKEPPLFLPYLNGERAPIWNPNARGVFFGLGSEHREADLVYSVLEGVAFSLRHIWDEMIAHGDKSVRMAGGASVNTQLNRIKAALFETSVEVLEKKETSALGAAMCAAVGAKWFDSIQEAANAWVRVQRVIEPDNALKALLAPRYQMYRKLVDTLTPLWTE